MKALNVSLLPSGDMMVLQFPTYAQKDSNVGKYSLWEIVELEKLAFEGVSLRNFAETISGIFS